MESSNSPTNSPFNQVQIEESKVDLSATIKRERESNLNIDMLPCVKSEREYGYDDDLHINQAGEDIQRWTVTSSAVIPLVKQEHSLDPDHCLFEPTQPGGAMQAPTLGTDLLSSSANGYENHTHCASKLSLLSSDAIKEDRQNSPKIVDTIERKDGDKSVSNTNPETGLPQGKTNASNRGGFTSKGHLSKHQKVRTGEKPYKCTVCKKELTTSGNLNRHKRSHTGEKPYKCSVCSKEFTQPGHLTQHQRTHTGERPYKCSVCGKKFTHLGNLTTHTRVHTGEKPYKCSVCEKEFTTSGHLTQHLRTHTGERAYKCAECGKKFTHLGNLTTHIRVHTGEKPYKCSVCGMAYTRSSSLFTHQRIKHRGERLANYQCVTRSSPSHAH